MLTTDLKKLVFDILDAIEDIEQIKIHLINYQTFLQNRILRSASERELLIIGEAVNSIEKIDKIFQYRISEK